MKLIDEPGEQKAHCVAERTCENCEDKCCSDGLDEYIVLKEHCVEILEAYKFGKARHIEVGKAHRKGHYNRDNGEHEEKEHKGSQHYVAHIIALHLVKSVLTSFLP